MTSQWITGSQLILQKDADFKMQHRTKFVSYKSTITFVFDMTYSLPKMIKYASLSLSLSLQVKYTLLLTSLIISGHFMYVAHMIWDKLHA